MIDNFEIIKPLLQFDNPNTFYLLSVIKRKKDVKDKTVKSSRVIRHYYINSIAYLEEHKKDIITLCDVFQARAMINLNKRNYRNVALATLSKSAQLITEGQYKAVSHAFNKVCEISYPRDDRRWVVDIDAIVSESMIDDMIGYINTLPPVTDKLIAKIPSKSGLHIITSPFNLQKFKEVYKDIEVHRNNPTNLYIPDHEE